MQTIPTPTTRTFTRTTGETVTVTEWTIGAYTLRKTEEPSYTAWSVVKSAVNTNLDLPAIYETSSFGAKTPEFGVNWSACGTQPAADTRAYAALLATAADVADVFNEIVAAN